MAKTERLRNKKYMIYIWTPMVLLVLLIVATVVSVAALRRDPDPIVSTITTGQIDVEWYDGDEKIESKTYPQVIQPNMTIGNSLRVSKAGADCLLRVKIEVKVNNNAISNESFNIVNINPQFILSEDGYYYYFANNSSVVFTGTSVTFANNIKFSDSEFPNDWSNNLTITFIASAIQVDGNAVTSEWVGAILPKNSDETKDYLQMLNL